MLVTGLGFKSTLTTWVVVCGLLGCSEEDTADLEPGSGSGSGSNGATEHPDISLDGGAGDPTGSGSEGGVIGVNGTPGSCNSLQVEQGCAGSVYEGEIVPLDIYVMFDQSGSMATVIDETTGATRFDAVQSAMSSFLNDWRSAGIGIGLGHFGHLPLGATSCDPSVYADPVVPMGRLPEHASAISQGLAGMEPTGETPTAAAIRGACSVTSQWKQSHASTVVVNLLVTDGEPKAPITSEDGGCNPTLEDAVAAAAECTEQGVPSYVLGVGPSLDNLNQIAAAGETGGAHLVAEDSSAGVLQALNQIRGDAQVPCEFNVTASSGGSTLDYSNTDVVFMDGECVVTRIGRVEHVASCSADSGGWYFDEQSGDRRIVLCERSCADVREPQVQFFYSVGCGIDPTIY